MPLDLASLAFTGGIGKLATASYTGSKMVSSGFIKRAATTI